ncbi:MAG: tyrosine-type recombinase/integrase [Pseudomonadota bacterium]
MGNTIASPGIELRKGARSESIRIDCIYKGVRCREALKLAYAVRRRGEVLNAIERGTFRYSEFFPDSPKSKLFEPKAEQTMRDRELTVGQLIRDYLDIARRNLELSSYNCYKQNADKHLLPKWDNTRAVDLTTRDLRLWIMSFNIKRKTLQLILTPLRNALELAVVDEIIESSPPFDSIKLGKIISREQMGADFEADPFDINEIEAILEACEREQERNMFRFAFASGLRPSEYIGLRWGAVNFVKNAFSVQGAFVDGQMKDSAKTLKGLRDVDMRYAAHEALIGQQRYTKMAGDLVFLHPISGEQWTGDKQIRERWRRILLIAGVRYRNPYQTRHTFASSLLMLGANPLYVATQLGHADTTMVTRTYGKWIGKGLDQGMRERLERLLKRTDPAFGNEFPKFA